MSRRIPAFARSLPEIPRVLGPSAIGARLAYFVSMRGAGALLWALSLLTGGCLVTDQVQLDPEITTPPIVLAAEIPLGSVIRFNANLGNELAIPLHIRDDDVTENLKVRSRIVTGADGRKFTDFDCPEPPIPANGLNIRDYQITIGPMELERNACNKIEFVVSSKFTSCKDHPLWFDAAADETNDLGRATFLVWEVSGDPLTRPEYAQMLVSTCPAVTIDRTPQSTPVQPMPVQPMPVQP
jgi:hypothetical protein